MYAITYVCVHMLVYIYIYIYIYIITTLANKRDLNITRPRRPDGRSLVFLQSGLWVSCVCVN